MSGKGHRISYLLSEMLDISFLVCLFSQSLVNLLVTGHAVSNVWDGDRECSGMSKTFYEVTAYTHEHATFTQQTYAHTYHTHRTLFCGPRFKPNPPEGNNSSHPTAMHKLMPVYAEFNKFPFCCSFFSLSCRTAWYS